MKNLQCKKITYGRVLNCSWDRWARYNSIFFQGLLKFGIAHFGADRWRAAHAHWIHACRILAIRPGSVSVRVLHVRTHHWHLLVWILNWQRIRPCGNHHAWLIDWSHHWAIRVVLVKAELTRLAHAIRLWKRPVRIQHGAVHWLIRWIIKSLHLIRWQIRPRLIHKSN